jgi:hypothetical protein
MNRFDDFQLRLIRLFDAIALAGGVMSATATAL